uniref:Uncharacterized protein n=1 Tax=Quercus lobata TaxID=97700 RepID=A0A7N2ME58_QUELO
MAKTYYLTPILVIFFMSLIISFPSSSSARPLNKPLNLAANEPHLELELPEENVVVVAYSLDKDSHHVLPCDMEPSKPSKLGFPYKAPRLAGKYGPLLLNALPKGVSTPPSGPSGRIQDGSGPAHFHGPLEENWQKAVSFNGSSTKVTVTFPGFTFTPETQSRLGRLP